jgi:hypothetical protein
MPRGYADFGLNPGNYGQFSGDNAELAVRLGSPDVFERRGRVVWFDDMSKGLYTYFARLQGAGTINYYMQYGYTNGLVHRFLPPLVAGQYIYLTRSISLLNISKVGMEILIRVEKLPGKLATVPYINFSYMQGVNYYRFLCKLDPNNNDVIIADGAVYPGVDTIVYHSPYIFYVDTSGSQFTYLKMVVDLTTLHYDRLVFNEHGVNLSAYTPAIVPDIEAPKIQAIFGVLANADAQFVDFCSPLVTIDEP